MEKFVKPRLVTAFLVAVLAAAGAEAKTVRLFAVGCKQRVADAVSYRTFHGLAVTYGVYLTASANLAPSLTGHLFDITFDGQTSILGNNDVFFAASCADDERVDDTGDGPSNQYNPDVAITRSGGQTTCYVVWEDTRDGDSDVYLARKAL